MKRIFTFLFAFAICVSTICAQSKQGMVITCKDATVEVALQVVQKITYQDESAMIIAYNNGNSDTQLAIDNILSVKFAEVSDVVAVEKIQAESSRKAGVYRIDGTFVKPLTESTLSGALNGMQSGVYVVVMDGKSIKVKKGE